MERRRRTPPGSRSARREEASSSTDDLLRAIARPPTGLRLLAVNTRLHRYEVRGVLGVGGMSIVYVAHDLELDRKVAIKLLRRTGEPGGAEPPTHQRLHKEALALAKLSHPNIVTVHDVGFHDGEMWIAMEYIEGTTLREWARARPRNWRACLSILIDVARGMAAAHAQHLVHRDLKPDNVMIGNDGRVRIMDFGLVDAWSVDPKAVAEPDVVLDDGDLGERLEVHLTETGVVLGSPAYSAPERWRGETAGPHSDQFAWGVLAWETLHGRRPFDAPTLSELRTRILSGVPPTAPDDDTPAWLQAVVDRSLAFDPNQRWPSIGALADELERGASTLDPATLPAGGSPLASTAGRRRLLFIGLASAGIAGLGALVLRLSTTAVPHDDATPVAAPGPSRCHIAVRPSPSLYTSPFNMRSDCICSPTRPDCHQLYQARVIAIHDGRADLEFKKVTGGPPRTTVHYWVLTGSDHPTCDQLDQFETISNGYWSPRHDTLRVENVPIWDSDIAFDRAPEGATRTVFLATGDGAGDIDARTWFQPQPLVFAKVCAETGLHSPLR